MKEISFIKLLFGYKHFARDFTWIWFWFQLFYPILTTVVFWILVGRKLKPCYFIHLHAFAIVVFDFSLIFHTLLIHGAN